MEKFKRVKNDRAVTLIALVVTIVVLLILAGISVALLTGENGIIEKAQKAKKETEQAAKDEEIMLSKMGDYINQDGRFKNGVNEPDILPGTKKIMFTLPEGNNKGKIITEDDEEFDEENWYNYKEKKWANVQTEDGSMWVWIPRYAYKIIYNDTTDKSKGGTIDIKFLIGISDEYYDENGNRKTAKRARTKTEIINTTEDYYVHPAFTNERNIDYANGGWDKELYGIWIAKFEAGYASGNNNAPVKSSSVNYTSSTVYIPSVESGTGSSEVVASRNWLDGIYGETKTPIKYPTFQGTTYSMNYITHSDAYDISRALTEDGNIYGLNSKTTDSHLMKNSEWGAVTYLAYSKYGLDGQEPYKNNVTLNSGNRKRTDSQGKSGEDSVYAVTGLTTGTINGREQITTIKKINEINENNANTDGVYTWEQTEGQKASTTGNMYGIYDLNGGFWERISAYIPTIHINIVDNGKSIAYDGDTMKTQSTKYATVYPLNSTIDSNPDIPRGDNTIESPENYMENKVIFGDAVREISTNGTGTTAWNGEDSFYPAWWYPFFYRGGYLWRNESWGMPNTDSVSGLFTFCRGNGFSDYSIGFRPVLVSL